MSTPSATPEPSPAVKILGQAAEGLLYPSETDAPFTPFFWPHAAPSLPTPETIAALAGLSPDQPIKSVKLDTFFRPATKNEDWHNDEEKAEVERFANLVKAIKDTLENVKVFRVGETKIDVYIVGTVDGGYAGLKTQVVET